MRADGRVSITPDLDLGGYRQGPPTPESQRRGARIRQLRKAAGWTQEDVASRANTSQPSWSAIERGLVQMSEPDWAGAILAAGLVRADEPTAAQLAELRAVALAAAESERTAWTARTACESLLRGLLDRLVAPPAPTPMAAPANIDFSGVRVVEAKSPVDEEPGQPS